MGILAGDCMLYESGFLSPVLSDSIDGFAN